MYVGIYRRNFPVKTELKIFGVYIIIGVPIIVLLVWITGNQGRISLIIYAIFGCLCCFILFKMSSTSDDEWGSITRVF